jgi:RimJ/RimL family protein N-acetyltransferase
VDPPAQPLTDGVVVLRPPDDRDLDAIARGIADPDVNRWIGPQTLSASEVLERNRQRWLDGTGPTFAICDLDDACVGHAWVNVGTSGVPAVGYWLLPEARGRGLATRSVRLLCDWAFETFGVPELGLVTEAGNVRSQHVAEASGFVRRSVREATTEPDGRRVENIVYALARDGLRQGPRAG